MKPSVYIETSVFSYLTAWRSPKLVMAANQEATRDWWDSRRPQFDLFVSTIVVLEASAGDPDAAKRRTNEIGDLPVLDVSVEVELLAAQLLSGAALPEKAKADALHIAVAAVHGVNYLLTWNCKHIANAAKRPAIEAICRMAGYEPPIICTPLELMGE
jgi:predicted nucleic acid-binding protein